jgi:hypothetical protein
MQLLESLQQIKPASIAAMQDPCAVICFWIRNQTKLMHGQVPKQLLVREGWGMGEGARAGRQVLSCAWVWRGGRALGMLLCTCCTCCT